MTKRLSIIALVISISALLGGLFFLDVDERLYEWTDGPPLITESFGKRLFEANKLKDRFSNDLFIASSSPKEFLLSDYPPGPQRKVFILFIKKKGPKSYDVVEKFQKFPKTSRNQDQYEVAHKKLNQTQLNKLIDKHYFSDPKTRKTKKERLLQVIDETRPRAKTLKVRNLVPPEENPQKK